MVPDIYLLGKALGGGVVPLSAVVADRDILGVLHPGEHGSTFGGNPLAAAIGTTVVAMLQRGEFQSRSTELGAHLHARLRGLIGHGVVAVRGLGLWAGVDIDPALGTGKQFSLALAEPRGARQGHPRFHPALRSAPGDHRPTEIDWAVEQFAAALADARQAKRSRVGRTRRHHDLTIGELSPNKCCGADRSSAPRWHTVPLII